MFDWFKKKPAPSGGPDYSAIDSREKAEALHARGALALLYLFPIEFGGAEAPQNAVYVPAVTVALKARFDALVSDLLDEGKVDSYSCSPEYRDRSFVPCALVLEAKGEGGITERIVVW